MRNIRIAFAQIPSVKGNISNNIQIHLKAIEYAHQEKASCIFFPELSLTGYEPELASTLALDAADTQLTPLIDAAKRYSITLGIGAPIKSSDQDKPYIGTLIISPQGDVNVYHKMHLHDGEELFFTPGNTPKITNIHGHPIALAVCADTLHMSHAHTYAVLGARIYIAGVLITQEGYQKDTEILQATASRHNMLVGMANHSSASGGWESAGKSAIFLPNGEITALPGKEQGLVIATYSDAKHWEGYTIIFNP